MILLTGRKWFGNVFCTGIQGKDSRGGGGGGASHAQKVSNAANPAHSVDVPEPALSSLTMMLINWLGCQSKHSYGSRLDLTRHREM
jgi:hypothetical protein